MQLCLQPSRQHPGGTLGPGDSHSLYLVLSPWALGSSEVGWGPSPLHVAAAGPHAHATGEARRSANYTTAGPDARVLRRRRPRVGWGGSQRRREPLQPDARQAGTLPARGRCHLPGGGARAGPSFLRLRRTGVGRTHPDHEGLQRHREPGFRRLQSVQPAPFVSIVLFRRGLCLVHQSPERGFAAAGASGAPEVPGAASFFSNSSWLPGAVRARVTVRVWGGALRVGELPTPVSPVLQHAPGLSVSLLPFGPHAR